MGEQRVRAAAVAGAFYPGEPPVLRQMVRGLLNQAPEQPRPCALVLPHAGYIYSGYTAACGYRGLSEAPADNPARVVLIGPSHRVHLEGVSVGEYHLFSTPLGTVEVDQQAVELLASQQDVTRNDLPHREEHSLEVHLPFLQETVRHFRLVPMVYGRIDPRRLADLILLCWRPGDILIASSDLSHFHPDDRAKRLDALCHRAMAAKDLPGMAACEACGLTGMAALVELANRRNWKSEMVDYRTSGDVTGERGRVVGYASYLFYPQGALP